MTPDQVNDMNGRGAAAGNVLVTQFDPATATAWPDHCWLRYRATMDSFVRWMEPFAKTYTSAAAAAPNYAALIAAYQAANSSLKTGLDSALLFGNAGTASQAAADTAVIAALLGNCKAPAAFGTNAPQPAATLRMRPPT
jgi:hypothetical protein